MTAIKCAYWLALMVMAAITVTSFLLLQHMLANRQIDDELIELSNAQRALSQRVVFLAYAANDADRENTKELTTTLRSAVTRFELNYDRLLDKTGAGASSPSTRVPGSLESILFAKPHHLDYFSTQLAAHGWRLISALETESGDRSAADRYLAERNNEQIESLVADATLEGYGALSKHIARVAEQRGQSLMTVHRNLFYVAMAAIVIIALLIFRPMASMIERRTHELVEARNAMAYTAEHDALTGLHNRAFLLDSFPEILERARQQDERVAVLQIDLDRFKQINDTLGHAAGDLVLVRTAERMRAVSRDGDLTVRLGGDEFVVVIRSPNSFASIQSGARRLLDRINEPVFFNGTAIMPGASVGIAVYPDDAAIPSDLMVHADLALYSAKRMGGGASTFFSGELRRELDQLKDFAQDIKVAVAAEAFCVFYQPQVDIRGGRVSGVEALVRWHHPERGTIAPATFLPVAEKSGLMSRIGRIVLRKAVVQAALWHHAGITFGRLAVNISSAEIREPDFESFVFGTLAEAGLPPELLSLEIVESVILDDEKTGIATKLRSIRAAGIHLELDDFGTGYASLTHVDPAQIDRVKIDRRFVQDINLRPDNAKIVRAMSDLAHSLGIEVIAEGAETQAELDVLMNIGCTAVQGYVIAFPMPASEAEAWLSQRWSLTAEAPLRIASA